MAKSKANTFPKLHNAAWPGLVGKGVPGAESAIDIDTMFTLTKEADVNGAKFDGIDLILAKPHFDINNLKDEAKIIAEKAQSHGLEIGTVVAPIWGGDGGGCAFGSDTDRKNFLTQVKKGCEAASELRKLGVRPTGCIRIDTAGGVADWVKDPESNQKRIAETFSQACDIAADHDEVLACEGEICWGGIHSWKRMLQIFEMVDRPQTLGFQADMAHSMLYLLGYNAPEDRLLPKNFDWKDKHVFDAAYKKMTDALRIWTVDFHVAQNDGTVFGSGTHDKTGRHCLPDDPNGKLDITHCAGFWLRDEDGLTKRFNHLCWDGCMFPNAVMQNPKTWNSVLAAMIDVRDKHGWK
jgi:sugar phosphate isomerase/epimerase